MSAATQKNNHMDFNAADADITIISSDNVTFKIHSVNLSTHSNAFPTFGFSTDASQPARFEEHSDILKVLFAWIYPDDPPDPQTLPYTTLLDLAHAAHKYRIGSLILVCDIRIFEREAVRQKEPIQTLKYALLYAREAKADLCARETIMIPAIDMVGNLDTVDYIEWTLYKEHCLDLYFKHTVPSPSRQGKQVPYPEVQKWIKKMADARFAGIDYTVPFARGPNRT
ncbi:hypothetical protein CYLTODRAFT_493244 [Cylindrobasidium torrendii FP15055 ss-10]|uniref:BTB domain-containing protein n=1 Tax=Cylindrobasidium torrendii FP15055 ss-10 TaxID=1314674 RepID=A0A0D7B436_9AGAR|nr:hypothetical protein CYLTODRAFT_493244 [Cylindrobasidium torrendii FP15055 ss-10]